MGKLRHPHATQGNAVTMGSDLSDGPNPDSDAPHRMTIADRWACVRAAIERIEKAREAHLALEADPTSTGSQRSDAKARYKNSEDEFGWQWRNVKEILHDIEVREGARAEGRSYD
jgi:hypothetical protein